MSTITNDSMPTNQPILASMIEFIYCDNAITQLKLNLVDYKIDYETNTLKFNNKVLKMMLLRCMR